jgi:hypothetical protein
VNQQLDNLLDARKPMAIKIKSIVSSKVRLERVKSNFAKLIENP